jgi:ABC-type lipoprotein export system ATPase subunit
VETHALSEISLEIPRGEYVSIAGPSGCGKSTLLSIVGLLDTATSGGYWLNAQDVTELFGDRAGKGSAAIVVPARWGARLDPLVALRRE